MDTREIIVGIKMITYNHEKYISHAIESVLMQKTNFRFELIIGEDCSTDRTREIVIDYYKKNPNTIRLVLNEHNLGMNKNSFNIDEENKEAKYTIGLEGDDYWTDPLKLQKQVDFLEEHPEYIAIAHNVQMVDANERVMRHTSEHMYMKKGNHIYDLEYAERVHPADSHMNSVLRRNLYGRLSKRQWFLFRRCKAYGDIKTWLTLACLGKVYYSKEVMSCYRRVTNNGDSCSAKIQKSNMYRHDFESYTELEEYVYSAFRKKITFSERLYNYGKGAMLYFLSNPNRENWNILISIMTDKRYKKILIGKLREAMACKSEEQNGKG